MATISEDPRFKLARALVTGQGSSGAGPADAINIFASLLELSRVSNGETSCNAALCQFEYGNALFRAVVRRKSMGSDKSDDDADGDKKPAANSQRDVMAAAAMKRSVDDTTSSPNKRVKTEDNDSTENKTTSAAKVDGETQYDDEEEDIDLAMNVIGTNITGAAKVDGETQYDDDEEDIDLAINVIDTSWKILLSHIGNNDVENEEDNKQQKQWALDLIPRVICCMGDIYLYRKQFANAIDSYIRTKQYREEAWDRLKQSSGGNSTATMTMNHLQCQRYLVETLALVAETLLDCPAGEDVVCYLDDDDNNESSEGVAKAASAKGSDGDAETKRGRILVKAKDRMEFAQSYYEAGREGLEELLMRYGKMAAAKMDLGDEKKDIRYLVLNLVGVGQTLNK